MQKVLQDKQISGFELRKLIESGARYAPATCANRPRVWPHLSERHDVSENSAPAPGGAA